MHRQKQACRQHDHNAFHHERFATLRPGAAEATPAASARPARRNGRLATKFE
jgi:hypothetical protein